MKRFVIALVFLLTTISLAAADPPFTRRSSQQQHDGLKKYYEVADFRLGGRYDLGNPASWQFGGAGGDALESVGAGQLSTAYTAIGTPRRTDNREITNAVVTNCHCSGDSAEMYEQSAKETAI